MLSKNFALGAIKEALELFQVRVYKAEEQGVRLVEWEFQTFS
jgi:hypothetical protein